MKHADAGIWILVDINFGPIVCECLDRVFIFVVDYLSHLVPLIYDGFVVEVYAGNSIVLEAFVINV